ncbi:PepSY domain-containing protein [Aeromonas veronii]
MNRALPLLGLLLPLLAQAVTPDEAMLQQAVHEGRARPFHEMMEVAARLPVRVLRVDLGEEDGIWLYELRVIDRENSVIKVAYRADNLELVWAKGHHLERLFEPPKPPVEDDE